MNFSKKVNLVLVTSFIIGAMFFNPQFSQSSGQDTTEQAPAPVPQQEEASVTTQEQEQPEQTGPTSADAQSIGQLSVGAPETLEVLTGPDNKVTLPIESRTDITHDTAIFRLKFPTDKHVLGYPVGYHIRI
jgi:hypothetical protein